MRGAQSQPSGFQRILEHITMHLRNTGQLTRDTGCKKLAEAQVEMIAITLFIGPFGSLFGIAFAVEKIYAKRQGRLGQLICKHNDYGVAHRVFRREVWQGQSETQLLDSRGEPAKKNRLPANP
jgi:hypothetical protein